MLACLVVLGTGCAQAEDGPRPLVLYVAASAGAPARTIADAFTAETGVPVQVSAAATSTLARQVEVGAPADVFIAANPQWMDRLERAGRLEPGTRRDLLGNALVLVVPAGAADPGDGPPVGRIAIADPDVVPAGIYGRQALERRGWWKDVEPRLVTTTDVRAALRLAELGETDAAIVYASDAATSGAVRVQVRFDEDEHDPIVYPAALMRGAGTDAARLLEHFAGPGAARNFAAAGFVPRSAP